ncbi:hypothetical protein DFH06DRAFT_1297028 [Mycena polygramma]|nr:hypothetical protein DFH06DRAFT_1297028 [Mycena polygramma]
MCFPVSLPTLHADLAKLDSLPTIFYRTAHRRQPVATQIPCSAHISLCVALGILLHREELFSKYLHCPLYGAANRSSPPHCTPQQLRRTFAPSRCAAIGHRIRHLRAVHASAGLPAIRSQLEQEAFVSPLVHARAITSRNGEQSFLHREAADASAATSKMPWGRSTTLAKGVDALRTAAAIKIFPESATRSNASGSHKGGIIAYGCLYGGKSAGCPAPAPDAAVGGWVPLRSLFRYRKGDLRGPLRHVGGAPPDLHSSFGSHSRRDGTMLRSITLDMALMLIWTGVQHAQATVTLICVFRSLTIVTAIPGLFPSPTVFAMRLMHDFLFFGAFAALSFVSGLRNVTLDDNDPSVIYSSGWNVSTESNPLDVGGFIHYSADPTATASLTFRGVAVFLMSPLCSSSAGAQVVLDGQAPLVVDLQDHGVAAGRGLGLGQATIASQAVWGATELADSEHTVVISMPPGVQNVVLDGLIVTSAEALIHDNAVVVPAPGASSTSSTRPATSSTAKFSTSTSSSASVSTSSLSFIRPTTTSSQLHSSSNLLSSSTRSRTSSRAAQTTNLPVKNIVSAPNAPLPPTKVDSLSSPSTTASPTSDPTDLPIANAASSPIPSISIVAASSAAPAPAVRVDALSSSAKRSVVIGAIFAVAMLILVVIVLLTCLRRRRVRQRRQRMYGAAWSQKFTPYATHPSGAASKPAPTQATSPPAPRPPSKYQHSPTTAAPLLPAAAPARRIPRSPLATAPPIVPPTPSPQTAAFPPSLPPAVHTVDLPPQFSPAPTTPLPLTPLPPATPRTPWSPNKSHRLSSSSGYSYMSTSIESGAGYGWTTPSLVGIHPFSALAAPEASAGSSGSSNSATGTPTTPLTPRLNEKSAMALFRANGETAEQRVSAAPAYREKDATGVITARRSQASESAPPVYEP